MPWDGVDLIALTGLDSSAWNELYRQLFDIVLAVGGLYHLPASARTEVFGRLVEHLWRNEMRLIRRCHSCQQFPGLLECIAKREASKLGKSVQERVASNLGRGGVDLDRVASSASARPDWPSSPPPQAQSPLLVELRALLTDEQIEVLRLRAVKRETFAAIGGYLGKSPDACRKCFDRAWNRFLGFSQKKFSDLQRRI